MTAILPKAGELWQNKKGAVRYVRHVDDDGYAVTYNRPAPAPVDWLTVLTRDWQQWVESTQAVKLRKAATVEDKDWSYAE